MHSIFGTCTKWWSKLMHTHPPKGARQTCKRVVWRKRHPRLGGCKTIHNPARADGLKREQREWRERRERDRGMSVCWQPVLSSKYLYYGVNFLPPAELIVDMNSNMAWMTGGHCNGSPPANETIWRKFKMTGKERKKKGRKLEEKKGRTKRNSRVNACCFVVGVNTLYTSMRLTFFDCVRSFLHTTFLFDRHEDQCHGAQHHDDKPQRQQGTVRGGVRTGRTLGTGARSFESRATSGAQSEGAESALMIEVEC